MHNETEPAVLEYVDYFKVAPGIWGMKDIFVNIYMIANSMDKTWVLVDAGLKNSAGKIRGMAFDLFGDMPPSCIILTHAHFDHVGSVKELAMEWNIPVFCHQLEIPYLTGQSSYPPPDSSVGGGLMASMAWMFPKTPINIESYLRVLPVDGEVPFLWGWKYFHTPGHAPGHISLFREQDKVLISGDAVITTKMESLFSVMTQSKILSGPPKYFTYDWEQSRASVNLIWSLEPEIIASGHGKPMEGHEMRIALNKLDQDFERLAVPKHGRYVNHPAVANSNGIVYVPPKKVPIQTILKTALFMYVAISFISKKKKKMHKVR